MATTGINTEPISNSMDMIQEIKNMEARLNASLKKKHQRTGAQIHGDIVDKEYENYNRILL